MSYVCRVVGPAGRVEYLCDESGDPKKYDTPKAAWEALEEFSHKPEALNLYADVVDFESGEVAFDDNDKARQSGMLSRWRE